MKIVLGTKDGKTAQKEISEDQAALLVGKKIGEKVAGDELGYDGYEFEITGGSDSSGTPMRRDVDGSGKKRILAVKGIGVKQKRHGQKQRKTISANTIEEKTSQVNMKVTKEGKAPLVEAPAEENTEEKSE